MRLFTRTNEYVEVIMEDGTLVRANVEYHGTTPICTINGTVYVVSRLK